MSEGDTTQSRGSKSLRLKTDPASGLTISGPLAMWDLQTLKPKAGCPEPETDSKNGETMKQTPKGRKKGGLTRKGTK